MQANETAPEGRRARARWVYPLAGCAIFAVTVLRCWRAYVNTHERLYLLGSRRVADPSFLSVDFTWSRLSPTSFLYDHLLAPLWPFFDEFAIANIGRLVFWLLFAWSLAFLARTLRLPAFAVVAGFALWLLWGQTLAICGSPIEGVQVKSCSYPLLFFSLAFVMRGQLVRAGLAAGLATAMHVIVGGWGSLAILLSMLVNRRLISPRRVGAFLLSAAPVVLPVVLAVALFHEGGVSRAERARMDETYVKLVGPYCCDMEMFMNARTWARAGVIFLLAPLLVYAWRNDAAKILGAFLTTLIAFFLLGVAAWPLHHYGLLKLFPGQLAKSLPALFLFVFVLAPIGAGFPARLAGRVVATLAILGAMWLAYDRHVVEELLEAPGRFIAEVRTPEWGVPSDKQELYGWIRSHTPRDSVFVTPYLSDFWCYAERAQVASLRHSPLDRRLLEWKERLEALKGFEPFRKRGEDTIGELNFGERRLTNEQLLRIRELYGATHYLTDAVRDDLGHPLVGPLGEYFVYDVAAIHGPAR